MKKILIVSVHPDDETLGCGGTILKHRASNDELHWLILTGASTNHPYVFPQEMIDKRAIEIETVERMFGFTSTINLNLPTQLLDELKFREVVIAIDDAIKKVEPNIIYMINRSDIHSDHKVAFNAVYACTKNFRKPYIEKILMYETLSETEFAAPLPESNFTPNVFSDITDFLERKLEIMSVYESEVMEENFPRSLNAIRALAAYRGSRIGVRYAEAFMLIFNKW